MSHKEFFFRAKFSGRAFFFLLLLRASLDYSYLTFVSPVFEYEGYDTFIDVTSYFLSWLIYVACSLFVPGRLRLVSDYFFMTMVASLIAPLSSLYGLSDRAISPLIAVIFSCFLSYILVNLRIVKGVRLPYVKDGVKLAIIVSAAFVLYLLLWYVASGAIFNFNLDFSKVYQYRSENSELTNIGLLAYFNAWVYQVFNIFLLVLALRNRWFVLSAFSVVAQIIFFGVSSHKSVLFYPFLVFFIWAYFNRHEDLFIFPALYSLVIFAGVMAYSSWGEVMFGSMFIRRVFYVPAILTYEYFSFFSVSEYTYWSNSILSWLVDYPYDGRVTKLIGEAMGTEASANNGYVSSGFSHAGYLGIFLYTVIISFVLSTVDSVSRSVGGRWFCLALVAIPYRTMILSSDLFTTLLTHGLLVIIILIIMMRDKSLGNA